MALDGNTNNAKDSTNNWKKPSIGDFAIFTTSIFITWSTEWSKQSNNDKDPVENLQDGKDNKDLDTKSSFNAEAAVWLWGVILITSVKFVLWLE